MDRATALNRLQTNIQWNVDPALTAAEVDNLLDDTRRARIWSPSSNYDIGDVVVPTQRNGHRYRCVVIGASGGTPANRRQTITISGTPTSGTFTLTITNPVTGVTVTTAAIQYNAAASAIQSAIDAAIGSNTVVSGGPLPSSVVTLQFQGTVYGASSNLLALITASSSLTGGTSPTILIVAVGVSGSTQPIWPLGDAVKITDGATAADTMVTWQEDGPDFPGDNFWDIPLASYNGWMLKASKIANNFDFKSDRQQFLLSQKYEHCTKMAESFAPIMMA